MMLRRIGAVIAGVFIAFVLVQVVEMAVHQLYPPPPGTDMKDFEQVKKFVASLPVTAYLLVLLGWLIGTVAGSFVAAKLGMGVVPGYVVGAVLLCAGIANSILIPQPVWFSIVSFAVYIGGAAIGARRGAAGYNPRP